MLVGVYFVVGAFATEYDPTYCHRRRSGCPHINNVACVLVVVVVEFVLVIHCIFTIFDENIYPVLVQLFRRYVCISAAALFLIS